MDEFGRHFRAMLHRPGVPDVMRFVADVTQVLIIKGHNEQDALGYVFQVAVMVKQEAARLILTVDHPSRNTLY